MTNDKLPEEMTEQIIADAKRIKRTLIRKTDGDVIYIEGYGEGYVAGATAWAQWKVKYDELQATIEDKIDKALHAERNKMQAKVTDSEVAWAKECQSLKDQAQRMADALEELNKAIDKTWNECNTKSIPDKYKKEIATAQALSCNVLQQFKDGGKEVENG